VLEGGGERKLNQGLWKTYGKVSLGKEDSL